MGELRTFIWAYEAKIHPNGTIKGRIEAVHGTEAMQKVKNHNLMVNSVSVKALKNQAAARKQKYEVYL